MNLKSYYQRIRDVEHSLTTPFAVVVSHETPDGGKDGLLTEVSSQLAARMIADGRAHLANDEAVRDFQQKKADAKRTADEEAIASKMQVTIVPSAELRKANRSIKE
jgi:hypothetical protein